MANGLISPDVATQLLGALASATRIAEFEELSARIAALESCSQLQG